MAESKLQQYLLYFFIFVTFSILRRVVDGGVEQERFKKRLPSHIEPRNKANFNKSLIDLIFMSTIHERA